MWLESKGKRVINMKVTREKGDENDTGAVFLQVECKKVVVLTQRRMMQAENGKRRSSIKDITRSLPGISGKLMGAS